LARGRRSTWRYANDRDPAHAGTRRCSRCRQATPRPLVGELQQHTEYGLDRWARI
jgi:hypothetical protein